MRAIHTLPLCILFLNGVFPVHANADLDENSSGVTGAFIDIGAGLTGVYRSSVAWGDYENDGDLDILLTGFDAGSNPVAKVYRNDAGGTFTDIGAGLTGVYFSSAAWGDYDNDGDLDILLTGFDAGSNQTAKVYRNDAGGTFTDIGAGLMGVVASSVTWGDYDNDGDLDILLTGPDGASDPVAKIYRNDGGGIFTDIGSGLTGVSRSSVAWGDYDNDGDLDILLTGQDGSFKEVAKVYRNDAGVFTDIGAGLTGVSDSSVAWGDYDNDGDLDILLTGYDLLSGFNAGPNEVAKIYRNDGGAFIDISAGLTGVRSPSVAWGDYDNDGDLDILLTGSDAGLIRVAKIYRNDAGVFTDIGAGLTGVSDSSVAWGDYDNDGDLDILLTGFDAGANRVAKIYRNDTGAAPNNAPSAPTNLSASWFGGKATFMWTASTDTETPPDGLSYNLRVGTTPGGNEITAAQADNGSGYRRVPALGNANQNLSWTLEIPAQPLYWSVQTIDGAWAGSNFAVESSLDVTGVGDNNGIPVAYALRKGVPNPFRSSARIQFDLPIDEPRAVLEVFDIGGRLVRTLHRGALPAGQHIVDWDGQNADGRDVAAGIYLYRLRTPSFDMTRRLVRIR